MSQLAIVLNYHFVKATLPAVTVNLSVVVVAAAPVVFIEVSLINTLGPVAAVIDTNID